MPPKKLLPEITSATPFSPVEFQSVGCPHHREEVSGEIFVVSRATFVNSFASNSVGNYSHLSRCPIVRRRPIHQYSDRHTGRVRLWNTGFVEN